ncbi:hypothetical protein COU14_02580 [Candidatus Kaiserbacteria bacterium CG10_big_fil_rev_8_21_14_0_10_44_10]|uniref:Uncharacterized protein n=1 Tax=Candidatus Kaiserbacteria bacterium CG10_big_fil_rev_8_21_14_0_10_44_10 TaxID=1974606 RepID=A0A2H0UH80_9BACT|nr:MAG: hypothetical protein COU14_02580 [Candidatus Kaiserbacteria bacterium CG10_big_fil_rev_8_21_14_0_10_44_10]
MKVLLHYLGKIPAFPAYLIMMMAGITAIGGCLAMLSAPSIKNLIMFCVGLLILGIVGVAKINSQYEE